MEVAVIPGSLIMFALHHMPAECFAPHGSGTCTFAAGDTTCTTAARLIDAINGGLEHAHERGTCRLRSRTRHCHRRQLRTATIGAGSVIECQCRIVDTQHAVMDTAVAVQGIEYQHCMAIVSCIAEACT